MKKNNLYLLAAVLAFLLILFSFFNFLIYYYESKPLQTNRVKVNLTVSNRSGLNLNNNSLAFGKVIPGSSVRRGINISNSYDFPVLAVINCTGQVREFLSYPHRVVIPPHEEKSVNVVARVHQNDTRGSYSGYLKVSMWPKN